MERNFKPIIYIIVLIIIILTGWYVYNSTKPNKTEVEAAKASVLVVPSDILSSPTIKDLDNFNQNGSLPIIVSSSMKGRSNPFANY